MAKENSALKTEVSNKYDCTIAIGTHSWYNPVTKKRQLIDLAAIDLQQADELVKAGFKYLVPKAAKSGK